MFERLLEAGYVIQEHNREMREAERRLEAHSERLREQEAAGDAPPAKNKNAENGSRAHGDYTLTLAQIVEAQHQIQARHLDLDAALAVVAEKVARITGASGAGIGILEEKIVRYRAAAGTTALPVGSEVPLSNAVCQASVRTGQVIRSEDVNTELLFDPESCRARGIASLVAVPIYQDGDIIGALELYFDQANGYAEQDIHTCQLMGGLVTEALGREAKRALKKSLAEERSTMLAAIERLRPDLAALAEEPASVPSPAEAGSSAAQAASACWQCGQTLESGEQFCGKCGAGRAHDERASMQSKLASALQLAPRSEAAVAEESFVKPAAPIAGHDGDFASAREIAPQEDFAAQFIPPEPGVSDVDAGLSLAAQGKEFAEPPSPETSDLLAQTAEADEVEGEEHEEGGTATPVNVHGDRAVWTSAAKAREFLESVAATHPSNALARFWRFRRGDFYLAVAVLFVLIVIRWGFWSEHSASVAGHGTPAAATGHRNKAPDSDLSPFDKLLIALGLADPPDAPEYKGNPDTQVWVDLQTAQYYCPGADLYGKTPKGKMDTQRDAQLDQFEPAYRKACD